jgi:hypothetical protein
VDYELGTLFFGDWFFSSGLGKVGNKPVWANIGDAYSELGEVDNSRASRLFWDLTKSEAMSPG